MPSVYTFSILHVHSVWQKKKFHKFKSIPILPIYISKNEEEDDQDHDQNYFFIFKISNDFTPFNLFVNLGSEL